MKKITIAFVLAILPGLSLASADGVHLQSANVDLDNTESLQRGARLFTNYCLSCHSAQYMRYNRMGQDLGLSDKQVKQNLMFASDKVGQPMTVSMTAEKAKAWFGTTPPDLSVTSRSRGADWLYTYLISFYADESRPTGVNNLVFPDVGMPHVLWDLEGVKKPIYVASTDIDGPISKHISGYEYVQQGSMSPSEYQAAMRDLTAFMVYMGEPIQQTRKQIGLWVMLFLVIFFVVAYYLKKEYWKDIH